MTCNKQSLGGVDIKRGIFQGDSLSPLLFVLCLIPLTVILCKSESAYQYSSNKEKINHRNGSNITKGINTWAVSPLRYSATFIEWNYAELTQLDVRTRKLMTMLNALHH